MYKRMAFLLYSLLQIHDLSFNLSYACMYIFAYNLHRFSLYSAICIDVFRADHLLLDKQLLCSSYNSSVPSFSQLPRVICLELRPRGLFLVQFSMFIYVILVQLMFWYLCWWEIWGTAPDIDRRQNLTSNTYNLSTSSSSPSTMFSESWVNECFVDISIGTGIHNYAFWLASFSVGASVCCKE